MKISLNWLKDYVDLSGIELNELVNRLTLAGLEVEEVDDKAEKLNNFVVGHVKEKKKHPNADKLSVCIVNDGTNDVQVICGAPNVEAGQKIVFAKPGTIIPKGGFEIKKAKIRGVESFGMICSEAELELSDEHSGILVLDASSKEGTPAAEALGLDDVILEIGVTPNRPDALSHIGVARDVAALYGRRLKYPLINKAHLISKEEYSIKDDEEKSAKGLNEIAKLAQIVIEDPVNCPRYSSKVVLNVEVKESPEWLKKKLTSIGLRAINNIVDVTNFIMYELGQPLHAFDLDRLSGRKIIIRSLERAEQFTTLDSKERKLPSGTLMICDAEKTIAIAGVMGGENSEISNETKNILIESAYFNAGSVRRTSRHLGLSTEASYRFERGTNPEGTAYAAERAAELISELSGGNIAVGVIDAYPSKLEGKKVSIRYDRITNVLGYHIPESTVNDILEKLEIKIDSSDDNEINAIIPLFRPDIEREIDVIEEIARIYGYENIPVVERIANTLTHKYDESAFADKLRDTAVSLGFYEMINNPLQSEITAGMTGKMIPVLNPQSADISNLRTSLIPGALMTVSRNLNHGEKNLLLFEIGNIFNKNSDKEINSFDDFTEETKLLLLMTGNEMNAGWNIQARPFDFYSLKGAIFSFNEKILLDNVLNDSYYLDGNTFCEYYLSLEGKGKTAGIGGKIKIEVLKRFDIDQDVYCFEYDVAALKNLPKPEKRYKEILKYPKVQRDFAFIFDKSVSYGEVIKYIKESTSGLLKSVSIFDLFESDTLGENKKSIAFALEFYDYDRTLTEQEVDTEFNMLIGTVSVKFNAKLRG